MALRHTVRSISGTRALLRRPLAASLTSQGGEIPIIDISSLRNSQASPEAVKSTADKIGDACENVGFIVITNHGVNPAVIKRTWDVTQKFFDLPVPKKLGKDNFLLMTDDFPYGYSPYGGEVLSKGYEKGDDDRMTEDEKMTEGDMKEMFAVGNYNEKAGMPLPRYPELPKSMKDDWQAYYMEMESLARALMKGFAITLELPPKWFEDKFNHHASSLRALNYPDVNRAPKPGQTRASAHTDYGVLTILKSGGPGLQVKLKNGEWASVPHVPGAYIINLGDLMARWTNDKWRSTSHRVVVPEVEDLDNHDSNRRQSIAFFCNLNMDANVEVISTCVSESNPVKYPPTLAGDHLMAKHHASTQGILDDSWMKDIKA